MNSLTYNNNNQELKHYVGLQNLGNTCYMNSLFQQFFMMEEFREKILSIEDYGNFKENNLVLKFQIIMANLKIKEKESLDPSFFFENLKDFEGVRVCPYEQKDVEEFFNLFSELFSNQLKVK